MNQGRLVFAQVMQHLPLSTFRRCVMRYRGEHKVKTFSCLDQFLSMAFAQLTVSREPARHRSMFARSTHQALSPRNPLEGRATLWRRIRFKDPETAKTLIFLTNNFALPALTIAELYRCRWQVELFFKWIKQHLRIKAFFGTSENAVKSQIWIAVSVYVLVAIVKKRLNLRASLYEILQILSLTLFERIPLDQLLAQTLSDDIVITSDKQLFLFE
jgi:hypothetical protein